MKQFNYTIKDAMGIHARPAGLLVREAGKYPCDITIEKDGKSASLKKLMALMALAVKCGNEVTISCEGEQEEEAAAALEAFLKENL